MARAAAKRNPRPKQAPRPQPSRRERRANRPVEETLFFARLRRQAKWVFVLLVVVFAGGFVFFGVGSGSTGIGDLFNNFHWFGSSSSGPSISKAQKRITANPKDAPAYLDLAHAYEAKKQDILAINALENYAKLKPRDTQALSELVGLYETQARSQAAYVQALSGSQGPQLAQGFGPSPTSPLGQALGSPIEQSLGSSGPSAQYQSALVLLQGTEANIEKTYRRLSLADPTTSVYLIQYAQAAEQAGDNTSAVAAYRKFVKLYPDDTVNVRFARQELKRLTGAAAATSSG